MATGDASADGASAIMVHVQRTTADYREAYSWLRWHTWSWWIVLFSSIGLAAFVLFSYGPDRAIVFVVVDLVAIVLYYYTSLSLTVSKMQRAHARSGQVTYRFTSEGFDYRSATSSSSNQWATITKGAETRRNYLLFYANTMFLLIPKTCVPEGQRNQFRALLQEQLGSRLRLR